MGRTHGSAEVQTGQESGEGAWPDVELGLCPGQVVVVVAIIIKEPPVPAFPTFPPQPYVCVYMHTYTQIHITEFTILTIL